MQNENRPGLFAEIFELNKPWKKRATVIHLVGLPLLLTMGHCGLTGPVGIAFLPFVRFVGTYLLLALGITLTYCGIAHFTRFGWMLPIKGWRQMNAWWRATWDGVSARAKEKWEATHEKGKELIPPAEAMVVLCLGIPLALGNVIFLYWLFNEVLGGARYGIPFIRKSWVAPVTMAAVITLFELFLGFLNSERRRKMQEGTVPTRTASMVWAGIGVLSLFEAGLAFIRGQMFSAHGLGGAEVSAVNLFFIGVGLAMPIANAWTGARLPYLGMYFSAVGGFGIVQLVKLVGLALVWVLALLGMAVCFPLLIVFAPPTLIYFMIETLIRLFFCKSDDDDEPPTAGAVATAGNGGGGPRRVYPKILGLLLVASTLQACGVEQAHSREHGQLPACARRLGEAYTRLAVTEAQETHEAWWHCAVDISGSNRDFWQAQIRACQKAAGEIPAGVGAGIWIVNELSDSSKTPDLAPESPLSGSRCTVPDLPGGNDFAGEHMLESRCRIEIKAALGEQKAACEARQEARRSDHLQARKGRVAAWQARVLAMPAAPWTSYVRFIRKMEDFLSRGGEHRLVLAGDLEEDPRRGDEQIRAPTIRAIGRGEQAPPQNLFRLQGLKTLMFQTLDGRKGERELAAGWERILRSAGASAASARYSSWRDFPAWEDPRWNTAQSPTLPSRE